MADRVSASITIGGRIPVSLLPDFTDHIAQEGLSTEWDGEPFALDHLEPGSSLALYAHQVAGGTFDALESWCQAHGLAFRRYSDGFGGGWDPERVVFTGTGVPTAYAVSEGDVAHIPLDKIEELGSLDRVRAHFAAADFVVPVLVIDGVSDGDPEKGSGAGEG